MSRVSSFGTQNEHHLKTAILQFKRDVLNNDSNLSIIGMNTHKT